MRSRGLEEPAWLDPIAVHAIHQRQLSEHGGLAGVRDNGALEAASAGPKQIFFYADPAPDIAALAAAYALGLVRNHPFVDGNKRVALVVSRTFLRLNSYDLVAPPDAKYLAVLELASRDMSEDAFAEFVRFNLFRWSGR